KVLRYRSRNRRMFEGAPVLFSRSRHYCPFRNPWRYGNRRHSNAESIELERKARSRGLSRSFEPIRRASGRRHMVINAAMLAISNQQQGVLPEIRIVTNRIVYRSDEGLAGQNVMIGVLIRSEQLAAAVILMVAIVRFDETVIRQPAGLAVDQEVRVRPEQVRLVVQKI